MNQEKEYYAFISYKLTGDTGTGLYREEANDMIDNFRFGDNKMTQRYGTK